MTTGDIAVMVARWRQSGQDDLALQVIIRAWCASATADGIPAERQLELLGMVGIHIGGGGGGTCPAVAPCPYCRAYGGGGHGGWCPNGYSGQVGDPPLADGPLEPDWVLSVAEHMKYLTRLFLSVEMRRQGEDPGKPRDWSLRWGQVQGLLGNGQVLAVHHGGLQAPAAPPPDPDPAPSPGAAGSGLPERESQADLPVDGFTWEVLDYLRGRPRMTTEDIGQGMQRNGLAVLAALGEADSLGLAVHYGEAPYQWALTAAGAGAAAGRRNRGER